MLVSIIVVLLYTVQKILSDYQSKIEIKYLYKIHFCFKKINTFHKTPRFRVDNDSVKRQKTLNKNILFDNFWM